MKNAVSKPRRGLLLLVTVLAQTLLPLVSSNLMTLSFFTARHVVGVKWLSDFLIGLQLLASGFRHFNRQLKTSNQAPKLLKFL
ncbi:hypothetical protein HW556_08300 [Hymenobacter sp. P5252]|uniref:Uncharacterized protein n=1 Tax=Hymenobacter terrestris TaxID=2748310 RepID=A0ABX2Q229_9BACT|nr:hypothetical protein [Hymenobacter terrestris]